MTETTFGKELKTKLLEGVSKLSKSVGSTLGPAGRTVLIKEDYGALKVTKDGVTVAKAFDELEDTVESIGAELAKKVSIKSANEVGDGTTTSTILAHAILEEGIKKIADGSNPVEIKKGIDEAVDTVNNALSEMAIDVTEDTQIKEVATISGNNDPEIGNLISNAIDKVGREGIVTIEESKTGETSLEVVEGMQFERGYKSPYFVTDNNTMNAVLDNPYILIVNGRISTANSLLNVLNQASGEDRPILIVAEDIDGEALATLIVNKMRGTVRVCAVKAPEFGDRRTMALEDLAVITGGNVISKDKGHKLDKITPIMFKDTFLGTARKVTISKDTTTIVDGGGNVDDISGRIEEIKYALDNQSSAFEKEKLQERLGKLVGGVAIINVGGNSELEIKEKKDRVEDALFATKAALDEGIVVGGGTALLYASGDIAIEGDDDKAIGRRIVAKAILNPFYKILTNAGHDDNEVRYTASKLIDSGNDLWAGLDYKTLETIDFKKAGIIDPKKVTRIALENAASIAGTILTTESVVYKTKDDKEEEVNPMAGLM